MAYPPLRRAKIESALFDDPYRQPDVILITFEEFEAIAHSLKGEILEGAVALLSLKGGYQVTNGKVFLASCSTPKQYFIFNKSSTAGLFEGAHQVIDSEPSPLLLIQVNYNSTLMHHNQPIAVF